MYVIKRGNSWLCSTAIEAFEVDAIQLRLQGAVRDFEVFQRQLDSWERLNVGVLEVFKCSNSAVCVECTRYTGCTILKAAQETAKAHKEWVKWVESNGGYTF